MTSAGCITIREHPVAGSERVIREWKVVERSPERADFRLEENSGGTVGLVTGTLALVIECQTVQKEEVRQKISRKARFGWLNLTLGLGIAGAGAAILATKNSAAAIKTEDDDLLSPQTRRLILGSTGVVAGGALVIYGAVNLLRAIDKTKTFTRSNNEPSRSVCNRRPLSNYTIQISSASWGVAPTSVAVTNQDGQFSFSLFGLAGKINSEISDTNMWASLIMKGGIQYPIERDGNFTLAATDPETKNVVAETIYIPGEWFHTPMEFIQKACSPPSSQRICERERLQLVRNRADAPALLLVSATSETLIGKVLGRYKGSYRKDLPHGHGTKIFDDGRRYEGGWKDGLRHGTGTWVHPGVVEYRGQWKNDKFNGHGQLKTKDFKYVGGFIDGLRHGAGRIEYVDGTGYSGQWVSDEPQGRISSPEGSTSGDIGCHQLVALAAGAEAAASGRGKKPASHDVKARYQAAKSCLKKSPLTVHAKDSSGATPLHVAANFGGIRIATTLIELGADPYVRDNSGNSPADHAAGQGYPEIVKLLTGSATQTDWSAGKAVSNMEYVSSAGSILKRTWAGEVLRICTIDGKAPAGDHGNIRMVVRMKWGSSENPCRRDVLFFAPHELKEVTHGSFGMVECAVEPEREPTVCRP